MVLPSWSIFRASLRTNASILPTCSKISNWRYLVATCSMFLPSLSMYPTDCGYTLSICLTISTHPDFVARNNGISTSPPSPPPLPLPSSLLSFSLAEPYFCILRLLLCRIGAVISHEVSLSIKNLASSTTAAHCCSSFRISSLADELQLIFRKWMSFLKNPRSCLRLKASGSSRPYLFPLSNTCILLQFAEPILSLYLKINSTNQLHKSIPLTISDIYKYPYQNCMLIVPQ